MTPDHEDYEDAAIEPICFYCMCCGHDQEVDDECDKCGADCMEPFFD